jgi:hypothetical protein
MTPIALRRFAILSFACIAAPVLAQAQATLPSEPGQVTDVDIVMVQANIEVGCVKRGLERGAPEAPTRAFCACVTGVLRDQLTKEESQRLVMAAIKSDEGALQGVFQAHRDAMMTCKKD